MARATIDVTNTYQQIAAGVVTITVTKSGSGVLYFNEVATDADALDFKPNNSEQFIQDETKDTWVRTDGSNWVIVVDGVLV